MYTTISTKNMDRNEWLKIRKTGLGGSDAGAVCGLNPHVSPMAVYRDKVSDETDMGDNEAMRQGRSGGVCGAAFYRGDRAKGTSLQ